MRLAKSFAADMMTEFLFSYLPVNCIILKTSKRCAQTAAQVASINFVILRLLAIE